MKRRFASAARVTSVLAAGFGYLLILSEVIWMITPIAGFIYSRFALDWAWPYRRTLWVGNFFMPKHNPVGWVFIAVGTAVFLVCATQIYLPQLLRRGRVVDSLIYRHVRHPQYMAFMLIGVGFLLLWPRYIPLLAFSLMFGLYVLLARSEEKRMIRKYGEQYLEYFQRTSFLFPGDRRLLKLKPPPPLTAGRVLRNAAVLTGVVAASLAFGLLLHAWFTVNRTIKTAEVDGVVTLRNLVHYDSLTGREWMILLFLGEGRLIRELDKSVRTDQKLQALGAALQRNEQWAALLAEGKRDRLRLLYFPPPPTRRRSDETGAERPPPGLPFALFRLTDGASDHGGAFDGYFKPEEIEKLVMVHWGSGVRNSIIWQEVPRVRMPYAVPPFVEQLNLTLEKLSL